MHVSIHGHFRSGTHYLRHVVSANFSVIMRNDRHHALPGRFLTDGRKALYIRRDFEDVAKSIWAMKERFGAGAETFEEFKDIPWREQFREFDPSLLELGSYYKRHKAAVKTDRSLSKESLSPREYHAMHVASWESCQYDNVLIVDYEAMVSSFEEEMRKIAALLESNISEFKNIPRTGVWKVN